MQGASEGAVCLPRTHLLGEHVLHKVCHLGIPMLLSRVVQLAQLLKVELLKGQSQLHRMQHVRTLRVAELRLRGSDVGQLDAAAATVLQDAPGTG